jgi:hypothetical protein
MKKIIAAALVLFSVSAYAFCTNYTIQDASGRTLYCQKCCGPEGNCQVYCF